MLSATDPEEFLHQMRESFLDAGLEIEDMTLPEKISLDKIREQLRIMAKSEGGIGLDEGMINFDHIAELIYFQLNQNNGVIRSQGGS